MGILRFILAIAVVIYHANGFFGIKFTGGTASVQIFFIISGFYMTMILDKKYVGEGSYKLFITNRFLRIYPIFWLVSILTLISALLTYYFYNYWGNLTSYVQFKDLLSIQAILYQVFANIALFGQDIALFLGVSNIDGGLVFTSDFRETAPYFSSFSIVPQAWTLALELMFYLIAPFIVRKNFKVVLIVILFSLCARFYAYESLGLDSDPWTYRFFPFELALFLMGTISYKLYVALKGHKLFDLRAQIPISLAMLSMVIFYQFLPVKDQVGTWISYSFVCLSLPFLFELTKSIKIDNRIGELSYPIYVSHFLVIYSVLPFIDYFQIGAYTGIIVVPVTIILSYFLVRFVADPLEKVRQSRVVAFK